MLFDLPVSQILIVALLFTWAGFVRTGLGFGGAALGLPLMLFIDPDPLTWLPIIGVHLLFFSSLTLRTRLRNVDWNYLKQSSVYIVPAALVGVIGLINLPTHWLLVFIYSISLFYACLWLLNRAIESHHPLVDRLLLAVGGYVAGTSLTGAPLMVAVYMRNVSRDQLRNTLFVLWFTLVAIKMSAFVAFNIAINLPAALALLPAAAVGHVVGLRMHDSILKNDMLFKRWVGAGLMLVSLLGLWKLQVYTGWH